MVVARPDAISGAGKHRARRVAELFASADTFGKVYLGLLGLGACYLVWRVLCWILVPRPNPTKLRTKFGYTASGHEPEPDDRPATERQLNFIDTLIEERETEPWMLESDPETVTEASALIEALLAQPRRKD